MDVIQHVLVNTRDFESPVRYYYWSMLAATSAIVKDKVWFDMGDNYILHPNIYVMLYGPTGIRKGPPVNLAESLVRKVGNTRVIDGRCSIEALISELRNVQTEPGKPLIKDACAFMVASELSASIIESRHSMDIMTTFYDRQYNEKAWTYRLKNESLIELSNPTVTWLTATNEALFRDFMPEKNLNGGLLGRIFVITETKKNKTNSLMYRTVSPDKDGLVRRFKELSMLRGEFNMSDEVRAEVHNWYSEWDINIVPTYNDETGFVSRVEDFVIKIAMLISCARRGDLKLELTDVQEAMNVVIPLIRPTQAVVNKSKKDDASQVRKRMLVISYLARVKGNQEEKGRLLRNLSPNVDHDDLIKVAGYLIQANCLKIESIGGKEIYKLQMDRPDVAMFVSNYKT